MKETELTRALRRMAAFFGVALLTHSLAVGFPVGLIFGGLGGMFVGIGVYGWD